MKKYDLLVVGGGLTGIAAAAAASRGGLSVLLCEQAGSLGGAMNNNLVYPFMNYWATDKQGYKKYLSSGIFKEILELLREKGGMINEACFKNEIFKTVLDDFITKAGVDVIFHAKLYSVETVGRDVVNANFAVASGTLCIASRFFIDATGNGDLMAFAGCKYQLGRERDNLCQPMTTCFRLVNVDIEGFRSAKPQIQALYKQFKQENKITNPREDILTFFGLGEGILHFNTTRVVKLNPIDPVDISTAEMTARRQIIEMIDFLKSNFECFKNAEFVMSASEIGIRESRKLLGMHILTAEELMSCTKFPDGIALGNYDIDIHNPEGAGTSHYYFKPGEYYSIPYRSLLPREYDNLLVAGRCISATHEAQASVRIIPICTTLGQAAGTAAAMAVKTDTSAHNIDAEQLRDTLRKDGAAVD